MSVSTISKYWRKSSLFFRVMIVFVFMVAIGVSNFIGASLFAANSDTAKDSYMLEAKNNSYDNTEESSSMSTTMSEDDKSLMLYSID